MGTEPGGFIGIKLTGTIVEGLSCQLDCEKCGRSGGNCNVNEN